VSAQDSLFDFSKTAELDDDEVAGLVCPKLDKAPLLLPPSVQAYYQQDGIAIVHGDCREILPKLPKAWCSTCGVQLEDESILAIHLGANHDIRPYFDFCLTDPPYGVDYDGGALYVRDKLTGDKSANLYGDVLPILAKTLAPDAALYLFYADGDAAVLAAVLAAGFEIRNNLIWNKQLAQFGALSAQYKTKHEPFLYCHLRGESPRWFGPTNETTVWDHDRANNGNLFHPTQKPTSLIKRALRNSTLPSDRIIDPFMGGGSTLLAAREMGRFGIGIEVEEKFCEVAAKRLSQNLLEFSE
jgi:DNA modification methylase